MSRVSAIYPSDKITIREVGLRDGLQLVKSWPDTKQKSKWLVSESNAGVKHFEIGSFLPKQKFPQFSDINELIEIIDGINKAIKFKKKQIEVENPYGDGKASKRIVNHIMSMI